MPKDLPDRHRWKKLTAIGLAVNLTLRDGKETSEVRHYILSRKLTGQKFAAARGHWSMKTACTGNST